MISTTQIKALKAVAKAAQEYKLAEMRYAAATAESDRQRMTIKGLTDEQDEEDCTAWLDLTAKRVALFAALDELETLG